MIRREALELLQTLWKSGLSPPPLRICERLGRRYRMEELPGFAAPIAHREFFLIAPSEGIAAPLTSLFSKFNSSGDP
jgi:hypothetical protein